MAGGGSRKGKASPGGGGSHRLLAVGAHPDDIEFCMAGTMLLFQQAGWELHYMHLASGSCGSLETGAAETKRVRRGEAKRAAAYLGAVYHQSLVDDLEVVYSVALLRRLGAVVRQVNPAVILTHSPRDYMEDHTNTCRLAVTAAFSKGMPNFKTVPGRKAAAGEVVVYHAMPHGLRDGMDEPVEATHLVDTGPVHEAKREALALHQSQQGWLDASQGMNSYLQTLDDLSREVAGWSRSFKHAEGWRRHSHLGFCSEGSDPMRAVLGRRCVVKRK